MTSAFKNFFITFAVCLLVFVFLGFRYAEPWLEGVFDINFDKDTSETSSEVVSEETSESDDFSVPDFDNSNYNPDGDIFTAFVMCVDGDGKMVTGAFIDANGKTKRFVYCPIPATITVPLNVGDKTATIGDLFATLTNEEICQCVSAMTGIQTDYCLRFDRDSLAKIAAKLPNPSVALNDAFIPAMEIPDEIDENTEMQYVEVDDDGTINLNDRKNGKTNLEWILSYTPSDYNTEIHGEFTQYYKVVSQAIIRAVFQHENDFKNSESIGTILNACDSNLNPNTAVSLMDTIFSYGTFDRYDEFVYSKNRDTSIAALRGFDGRYN